VTDAPSRDSFAEPGQARHGTARQGAAWFPARRGSARPGKAGQGEARIMARRGAARLGAAGHGAARQGKARQQLHINQQQLTKE